MSNYFAGIGLASSGLNAARYGLNVVAQNMSNADTDGYVRQSAHQTTVSMTAAGGIYTRGGEFGGVTIDATTRNTDPMLDSRVRTEHGRAALTDTTSSQLSDIESVFNEPSEDGLSSQLSGFWSSWGTVGTTTGSASQPARAVLLQNAGNVAKTLNTMSASLDDVTTSVSGSLAGDVSAVNDAATRLASLNGQIAVANATGDNANALLDSRDQLLDTLTKLTGGTTSIAANGAATLTIGGVDLVSGVTVSQLTADSDATVSIGGQAVAVGAGSIGAEVTTLTTTLPDYRSKLDAVANSLRDAVNSVQTSGYDQNGNAGVEMFSGTGAADIAVILTDPAGVAAASSPGPSTDGSHAMAASQLGAASSSPDSAYQQLVGQIGSASALAAKQASTQDSVAKNVDALKSSVSGVSLDEEAANMLIYQQAFNASSRVLTAIDSMLDTLINHTGLVGLQ